MNNEENVTKRNCIVISNKDRIHEINVLNKVKIGKEIFCLNNINTSINKAKKLFPYCVVWTHLPLISAIIPFVGHTAICSSKGIIHEFAGYHQININQLSFGPAIKYVQCKLALHEQAKWDQLIEESDTHFGKTNHHLLLYFIIMINIETTVIIM